MVAAIKRACAQAGTIRQTIEATRWLKVVERDTREFNVEGRDACSGSRRPRLRSLMQGFGWMTDMPLSPAAPACRRRRVPSLPIALGWRRGLFLGCEDVRP